MAGVMLDRRQFGSLTAAALTAAIVAPARAAPSSGLLDRAKAALDRHRAKVTLTDRIGIADYALHSKELRFHIVDLIQGQDWSYLVAHGKGSDPEHSGFLQSFSNVEGSNASSQGAYVTTEMYVGQHGQSMRVAGLDDTNSNAADRAIVIHGAPYVTENHIAQWGKIGRSDGCFVFPPHRLNEVLALLGQGRLLYADKV